MKECLGLFGKWFGHNYEKIFDVEKGAPTATKIGSQHGASETIAILEATRSIKSTYKFSECSRCGDRIEYWK